MGYTVCENVTTATTKSYHLLLSAAHKDLGKWLWQPSKQDQSWEARAIPTTEQATTDNYDRDNSAHSPMHRANSTGFYFTSDVAAMTWDVNAQNKIGDALSRLYGK